MNNIAPLPAGTVLGKSFEYGLDINLGTYGSPNFQAIRRMSGFAPTFPKTTEDVATYDDLGGPNEDVTGRGFGAAFTVQANRSLSTGRYLPEVEKIIAAARTKGEAAVLDVRFYHKPEIGTPNPHDAGRAFVTVEVTRQNTGNSQNEILAVTFAGKGAYEPITNPFTGWNATVPVISLIETTDGSIPGTGDLIILTGTGLADATQVKFGAATAADFEIMGPGTIVALLPSGSAGDVNVTVVAPGGTSVAYVLTRAA